jgi:hypothetical protein
MDLSSSPFSLFSWQPQPPPPHPTASASQTVFRAANPRSGPLSPISRDLWWKILVGNKADAVHLQRHKTIAKSGCVLNIIYVYCLLYYILYFFPSTNNMRKLSIEWFIEGQAFLVSYNLAPRPLPTPPSVRSTPRRHPWRLRKRDNCSRDGRGGRGGRGAESYDTRKSWSSLNHSVLSVCGDTRIGSARFDNGSFS